VPSFAFSSGLDASCLVVKKSLHASLPIVSCWGCFPSGRSFASIYRLY